MTAEDMTPRLEAIRAEVEMTIAQWTKDAASLEAYASAGDDTKGLGWACRHDAAAQRLRVADLARWLEAGRLAAIRAEVENHVRWLDERLSEREGCHPDDSASQGETRQMYVELRDLCRWLEVTR